MFGRISAATGELVGEPQLLPSAVPPVLDCPKVYYFQYFKSYAYCKSVHSRYFIPKVFIMLGLLGFSVLSSTSILAGEGGKYATCFLLINKEIGLIRA